MNAVVTVVLSTIVLLDSVVTESTPAEDVLRELHSKFAKYNKDLRPNIGGDPEIVNVSLNVLSIQEVSAKNMDFTLEINFTQSWEDSRLTFEGNKEVSEIVLGVDKIGEIWRPDTYFVNRKTAQHQYQGPDTDSQAFLKIEQDGTILVTRRISLTADCNMYLAEYPLDHQQCSLVLSSFSHTFSDIVYQWGSGDGIWGEVLSVPGYTVLGQDHGVSPTQHYSGLVVTIQLARQPGHSIRYHFIPAAFMVALSWLSFLLDPSKTLARLVITLTPLLTILFLSTQAAQTLPPLSYWTAVDIYLCCCSVCVTAAVLVTIASSSWCRARGYRGVTTQQEDGGEDPADKTGAGAAPAWRRVDCGCLIILPILFILFNIVFWSVCGG